MSERQPGRGRYARLEREQRWVLDAVPEGAFDPVEIVDRYVTGTTLRLRRATSASGEVVHKLGQKVRDDPADPERVRLTNLYLTAAEHEVLSALPAAELRKTRRHLDHAGRTVTVDEMGGRHAGLVLAEVELGPDDALLALPPFARCDVSHDERWSGGALAHASDAELADLRAGR